MNTISGKSALSIFGMVALLFTLAGPATAATITQLASQPAGPITTDGATLYVGNGNSVLSVPIAGGVATTLYSGATPCCVAGLTRLGTDLFWIDPNGDPDATAIFRAPVSGGSITKIYSGFASGQPIVDGVGIATDGVKLYTTDDVQGRVHSLNPDGSAITQLGSRYGGFFAGEHFNTLTESGGILYIVDDGTQPSYSPPLVTSIPKSGGSFTTLHAGAPLVQPVAVAVGNGSIYVADHGANTIWQMPITGGAPTALVSGAPFASLGSNGLLFFNNALYVTDSSGIYRVDFGPPPPPTLSSIAVTPSSPSINVGQTQQFTATGTFSDGSTRTLISSGGTWAPKASMPGTLVGFSAQAVNSALYVLGGWAGGPSCSYFHSVLAYSPETNSWASKAPMPTGREGLAVGFLNGTLYATGGGISCGGYTDVVEAYDPIADTWTTVAPMLGHRRVHVAATVGQMLYVMGGHDNSGLLLSRVEAYDPIANAWTTRAPMPTPRSAAAAGVVNGIIYVVGGANGSCSASSICDVVEAYDPATDTWTTKAPMPDGGRAWLQVSSVGGILYAIGGQEGTSPFPYLARVDAYNPATDRWTAVRSMSAARVFSSGAVVNGIIYAVGGQTTGNNVFLSSSEAFTPPEAIWSSSATGVAAIAQDGLATAQSPGSTTVTATSGNVSGSTTLTVVSPNRLPVANAGPDQTVEASSPSGASVTLNGSGSSDPDGDALSYNWTGPFGATTGAIVTVNLPLGANTVTLFVDDGQVTDSDTALITVRDTTAPVLSVPDPITVNATGPAGAVVDFSATAADIVDANPSVSCSPASGSTFALGTTTVTCTATDFSGNSASASFTVRVVHTFNGFFEPVENPSSLNLIKAGSAVPVKFSLSGDFGLSIFAAGYPRSQAIACDLTTSVNGVEETVTAGGSSLSYDASADRYTYVWKTDKSWAGTCRQLVVQLNDGTFHWANFMMK